MAKFLESRKIKMRKPDFFNDANPKMLSCARWWWEKGFNVIPIQDDALKKPLCDWKQWENQRQTLEELDAMLMDLIKRDISFNIAVILGTYDGVTRAVVDLDKNEYVLKFEEDFAAQLSKDSTIMVKPSKGLHIFMMLKEPTKTKHLEGKGIKIDLQCEAAYVIAPPSFHATARNPKDGSRVRYCSYSNQVEDIAVYEGDLWLDLIDFIRARIDKTFSPRTDVVIVDELLKPKDEHEGRNDAGIKLACLLFNTLKDDPQKSEKVWAKLSEWNSQHVKPMADSELGTIFDSAEKHQYLYQFDRELARDELEVKQPLTPEIEEFLRAPNLEERLIILTDSKISGEHELRELIFFNNHGASITKRPFGVIVISLPGEGKSYVEEMMMRVFPEERVEQPTSVTEQVLNYLGKSYVGLIVRIDELFGVEEGMQTIRVWMTNGRLERWITDPDTHKAMKMIVDGCPAFLTSTVEEVE